MHIRAYRKKNLIFSFLNRAKNIHIDAKIFLLKDDFIKKMSSVFNLGKIAKRANWCMEPPGGHLRASAVSDQNSPNDRFRMESSSVSGVFPGPRGGEADMSLALPRWCAMQDQEPAPSGT